MRPLQRLGPRPTLSSCSDRRARYNRRAASLRISVRRSPAELVESLRPFTTSKTNAVGTGLALAHRHIVDSGGRLAIEAAAGGGLAVHIELSAEEPR